MANVKKGQYIEIEYTGKLAEEDMVFDTTYKKVAEEYGLTGTISQFGPIVLCLGDGIVLPGLEKELEEKETGKEYTINLSPEHGFGKKDAKMIKMVPLAAFKKNKIMPEPGMQINMDGMMGLVRTISGGRCIVDFNHPLSGKALTYKVKINRIVEDDKEKLVSFLKLRLGITDPECTVKDGNAEVISAQEIPKELQEELSKDINNAIQSIKKTVFVAKKKEVKEAKEAAKPEHKAK